MAASDSASGPHSVGSWAKSLLANLSVTSGGTCLATASAAGPEASTPSAIWVAVTGMPW